MAAATRTVGLKAAARSAPCEARSAHRVGSEPRWSRY